MAVERDDRGRIVKGSAALNPTGKNQWAGVRHEAERLFDQVARAFVKVEEGSEGDEEQRTRIQALVEKIYDMAIGGDLAAAKLIVERLIPTLQSVEHRGAVEVRGTDAWDELSRRLDRLGSGAEEETPQRPH